MTMSGFARSTRFVPRMPPPPAGRDYRTSSWSRFKVVNFDAITLHERVSRCLAVLGCADVTVGTKPGRPDFVLHAEKKVILVHDCQWHRHLHPDCPQSAVTAAHTGFLLARLHKNRQRDRRAITALKNAGWDVSVVWDCQAQNHAGLTLRIERFLNRRARPNVALD